VKSQVDACLDAYLEVSLYDIPEVCIAIVVLERRARRPLQSRQPLFDGFE